MAVINEGKRNDLRTLCGEPPASGVVGGSKEARNDSEGGCDLCCKHEGHLTAVGYNKQNIPKPTTTRRRAYN